MLIEPLAVVDVVEIRTPFWATLPATMVILPCGDEIVPLLMTLPGDVDANDALGTLGLAHTLQSQGHATDPSYQSFVGSLKTQPHSSK